MVWSVLEFIFLRLEGLCQWIDKGLFHSPIFSLEGLCQVNWQRLVSLSFLWAKRDLILPNVSLSRSSSRIANGACRPGFPFRNCLPPYGGWFWSFFSSMSRLIVFFFCGHFCHKGFFRFQFTFALVGILWFPRGSFGSLYFGLRLHANVCFPLLWFPALCW